MNSIDIKIHSNSTQIFIDGEPIDCHRCIGFTLRQRAGEPATLALDYQHFVRENVITGGTEVTVKADRGE